MSSTNMMFVLVCFVQAACASTKPAGSPVPPDPRPKTIVVNGCLVSTAPGKEPLLSDSREPLPEATRCLDWPTAGVRKVNTFFKDPRHPIVPGKHDGIDVAASAGTPLLASADGEVVWKRDALPCVDAAVGVKFAEGWTYEFHHLSLVDVDVGDQVIRGQILGASGGEIGAPGSGPWTTGAHLHFNLMHDGAHIDPLRYFCP
jgi:murein DD-endopeptidase MepM/ murein hydrolase activator NlpD